MAPAEGAPAGATGLNALLAMPLLRDGRVLALIGWYFLRVAVTARVEDGLACALFIRRLGLYESTAVLRPS